MVPISFGLHDYILNYGGIEAEPTFEKSSVLRGIPNGIRINISDPKAAGKGLPAKLQRSIMAHLIQVDVLMLIVHAGGDHLSCQLFGCIEYQFAMQQLDYLEQALALLFCKHFAVVKAQH